MARYIFVTGGVVSSLGKGLSSASLAYLLQSRGYKVRIRKLDPYLNVDPGTMSPFQHGEVFVTDDGAETDLDLGHYERFSGVSAKKSDNITTGKIYNDVLKKEREGKYLGKTVQVIPHITDRIKEFIKNDSSKEDFVICEIGGIVGDIESLPFIEAIRQFANDIGKKNALFIHLTLVPYLKSSDEIKTKPTQHSVKELRSIGVQPDIIICRSERPIPLEHRKKISLFCNVDIKNVIETVDVRTIYEAPISFFREKLDVQVLNYFKLKSKKFVYTGKIKAPEGEDTKNWVERDQLLFKSTEFGDDKDRALQKSDNTWTYFAGDVAYHNNKLNRNYDILVNILGADHAGYIKRITSVVEALSGDKNKLICKVSQLVKLIKDGKPFKMSKRKGDYITVDDLISEVGKDATRFIMLNRSSDAELDFDFTKVKEKSKDNPLYYVQYCYARISSVFRNISKNLEDEILIKNELKYSKDEIKIFRKISEWPKCIEIASNKLEPHRLPVYLYELSSEFHSYWNMGRDDKDKRFIEEDGTIKIEKLVFLKSIANVIKTGMNILGVDTPQKM